MEIKVISLSNNLLETIETPVGDMVECSVAGLTNKTISEHLWANGIHLVAYLKQDAPVHLIHSDYSLEETTLGEVYHGLTDSPVYSEADKWQSDTGIDGYPNKVLINPEFFTQASCKLYLADEVDWTTKPHESHLRLCSYIIEQHVLNENPFYLELFSYRADATTFSIVDDTTDRVVVSLQTEMVDGELKIINLTSNIPIENINEELSILNGIQV